MQGESITLEQLDKEREALLLANPELKKIDAEWEQEYELRKQIREARKESGYEQKIVGMLSGLDQRAISRVESNAEVSPSLKTIIKYLNAIGYKLEVVKAE